MILFLTLIATSGLWQDDESTRPPVRPSLFDIRPAKQTEVFVASDVAPEVEQAVIRRMLGSSAMLPLASEVESTNAITSVEEAMNEIDSIVKALQLSSTVDETVAKERLMEVMRSLNECFQGSRSWSDLSVSSLDMDEIISPAADVYDSDSSVDDDFLAQHRSHQRKLQETRLLEERVEELEGSLSRLSVQNARLRERARAQLE